MYKTNDFEKLFHDYQGLLCKAARQHHLQSIYEEAYAHAVLSFYEAVQNYDTSLHVPFAGYAKAKVYGDLRTLFKKYRRNWQREISADNDDNLKNQLLTIADKSIFEDNIVSKLSLQNAVNQLPPRQQKIIKYTIIDGCTQAQTAKILGISQQAVAANKKQALNYLKQLLS